MFVGTCTLYWYWEIVVWCIKRWRINENSLYALVHTFGLYNPLVNMVWLYTVVAMHICTMG